MYESIGNNSASRRNCLLGRRVNLSDKEVEVVNVIIENLRYILREKGMKQKHLAEKADISEKTMSAMMNGRREIHHEEIVRICNAIEVTPNDLYGIS